MKKILSLLVIMLLFSSALVFAQNDTNSEPTDSILDDVTPEDELEEVPDLADEAEIQENKESIEPVKALVPEEITSDPGLSDPGTTPDDFLYFMDLALDN